MAANHSIDATSDKNPPNECLPTGEGVRLFIEPRTCDIWSGTRAELQAEGLFPSNFEWPSGKRQYASWSDAEFRFELQRSRRSENWVFRREPSGPRDGGRAARLHELKCAIEHERWLCTREAQTQWAQYCAAGKDRAFQAFKALVPGLVPAKPSRKPKA
jgi:hypothetical protein